MDEGLSERGSKYRGGSLKQGGPPKAVVGLILIIPKSYLIQHTYLNKCKGISPMKGFKLLCCLLSIASISDYVTLLLCIVQKEIYKRENFTVFWIIISIYPEN